MAPSYLEQLQTDLALQAFVRGQCGQMAVELAALKVEHEHQARVIEDQQRQIRELERQVKSRRTGKTE